MSAEFADIADVMEITPLACPDDNLKESALNANLKTFCMCAKAGPERKPKLPCTFSFSKRKKRRQKQQFSFHQGKADTTLGCSSPHFSYHVRASLLVRCFLFIPHFMLTLPHDTSASSKEKRTRTAHAPGKERKER
jgi:hypothetical protein